MRRNDKCKPHRWDVKKPTGKGREGSAGRQGASHAAATFSLGLGGGAQMFTIEFSVRLGFFFLVGMHEMFPPKNVLFT